MISVPTFVGECCPVLVTAMEPSERNRTRVTDLVRGVKNALVIDTFFEDKSVGVLEAMEGRTGSFDPPVLVLARGEDRVRFFTLKHLTKFSNASLTAQAFLQVLQHQPTSANRSIVRADDSPRKV